MFYGKRHRDQRSSVGVVSKRDHWSGCGGDKGWIGRGRARAGKAAVLLLSNGPQDELSSAVQYNSPTPFPSLTHGKGRRRVLWQRQGVKLDSLATSVGHFALRSFGFDEHE